MKKTLLLFYLFIAGCANQDFPFCCDQTGLKDVPYTTTYDMSLATGFTNLGGNLSVLRIISQADIDNLFNAANVSKVPGTGVVSGGVSSLTGGSAIGVVLEATDRNGNKVGDLFYNSLGGIPDFTTTTGTADSNGGFTLLNAPPGEIYFKALQGGRGNGQAFSYPYSSFLTQFSVIPVVPAFIGMTGDLKEYLTENQVPGALISPIGLKGLDELGSSGRYRFPSLSSDSSFLFRASSSGYLPTYNEVTSELSTRPPGAVDVTQNLYLVSQALFSSFLTQTQYLTQNFSNGILVGSTRDPDDSLRTNPNIQVTDDQGNFLNFNGSKSRIYYQGVYPVDPAHGLFVPTYFYFDPTGKILTYFDANMKPVTSKTPCNLTEICPSPDFGSLTGNFVIFDLPPGIIHLSATTYEQTSAGWDFYAGEDQAEVFAGGVSIKKVTMKKMNLGVTNYYFGLAGQVTRPDGITPVGFSTLFAMGNAPSLTTTDAIGFFNIFATSNIYLYSVNYNFKVSHPPAYMDTYQTGAVDGLPKHFNLYPITLLNQYLSSAGLSSTPDTSKGILTGIIKDSLSLRGTDGVTLEATDAAGNVVGDVRYLDASGMPTLTQSSSKNGGYIIFNLPPGLIQIRVVSQDDTGNILAYIYPNGVVLRDLQVNNSPPPLIQVSGRTDDLDGTLMKQTKLSILGSKSTFLSDGSGNFSYPFDSNGQFTVKARSPQSDGIDTYNLFFTGTTNLNALDFKVLTAGKLQAEAASGNLTADLTLGFIGGKLTTSGFSATLPVPAVAFSPVAGLSQHKMVAGLFNEDNETDIALVNSTDNNLMVLLGGGDGTFRMATGSPLCMPRGTLLLPGQSCSSQARPVAVRATDLNGDGVADLIVANQGTNSVTILLGTSQGNFSPAPGSPISLPPGSSPIDITIGDFNNDHFRDLVVLNSGNNSFSLILGNGDGTFKPTLYSYYAGGISPSAIISQDLNGDGNIDLAIANSGSSSVSIFFGAGSGYFTPAPNSPIPVGSNPVSMTFGDLNSDGWIDLVTANQGSKSISILLGKGSGLFAADLCLSPPVPSFCSLNGAPEFVSLHDLNLDGRVDLIASSSSGDVSVLSGLGNGTFAPEVRYAVGGNPSNLLFSDFNDDGYLDLMAYQAAQGTLAFLPGISVPVPNISLLASDLNGNVSGQIRYLDVNGNIIPGGTKTDASGKFLIFNVPSGLQNVHATQGGSGNFFIPSYPGSATFANIPVIPPDYRQIIFSGKTIDPVGGQILRGVEGVNISPLGTGLSTQSSPVDGQFNMTVNAENYFLFKLQK